MRVSRRAFLVALGSVPFLQLPGAVPASPVAGWTFIWHDWVPTETRGTLCGIWTALCEGRAIVNPIEVGMTRQTLDQVKAGGYEELVGYVREATRLGKLGAPGARQPAQTREAEGYMRWDREHLRWRRT